jgi:hypothetical protein
MYDDHYPTIDKSFVHEMLMGCGKIEYTVEVGTTTAYIFKGLKPIGKRTILLRETNGQVRFEHISGLAVRFGCMGHLLTWLEEKRSWKDGAYILPTGT